MKRAEMALYEAKSGGRNRVVATAVLPQIGRSRACPLRKFTLIRESVKVG